MTKRDIILAYLSAIGKQGGKSTSEAKKDAARRNSRKGGWPKGKRRKARKA